MDDRGQPSDRMFDQVEAAVSQASATRGLPGVSMRISRAFDHGGPTFMSLDQAKRLRDALDAAIRLAEQTETSENNPPAALYGNIE